VFETWKNQDKDALLSNLEKNQELKSLLLEETPWVLQAQEKPTNVRRNLPREIAHGKSAKPTKPSTLM